MAALAIPGLPMALAQGGPRGLSP